MCGERREFVYCGCHDSGHGDCIDGCYQLTCSYPAQRSVVRSDAICLRITIVWSPQQVVLQVQALGKADVNNGIGSQIRASNAHHISTQYDWKGWLNSLWGLNLTCIDSCSLRKGNVKKGMNCLVRSFEPLLPAYQTKQHFQLAKHLLYRD